MNDNNQKINMFIKALEERAKELSCLYKVEELLGNSENTLDDIFYGIVKAIPPGWQYPDFCCSRLRFENSVYQLKGFTETTWRQASQIIVQEEALGLIEVFYTDEMPPSDEGPFLKEERKLIDTIAERIGHYILHQRLKTVFHELQSSKSGFSGTPKPEWDIMLSMLKKTDQHLFSIISRKMINHLFCKGIKESRELFKKLGTIEEYEISLKEVNRPSNKQVLENSYNLGVEIFSIASKYLSNEEILSHIQKWMNEEKSHFLVKALAYQSTPLPEIADAIRRYYHINPADTDMPTQMSMGIIVSLIRRFLTDQIEFINIAKHYSRIGDFYNLLENMIFPAESHGKLGGKSSGLFLANKIIDSNKNNELLAGIRMPKTWYITSDAVMNFIYYNNLEEVIEQKYKDIEEIRTEYPHIVQAFKNSNFAPDIANGLSRALDDFGDNPIIVRSSSLLEDRMGSAFAGKYKSLFLANQGSKQERLEALMDAIAEVYASTFGPDPIGYRIERGLLDFHEEMGILLQEVVGKKVGKYFFPAFAGVAFSNNEFRWSPRIRRDDGLIRIVPGLGTRAVDRIGSDYPILIAPGQPDLRINLSFNEIVAYSPKNIDVINLGTNTFETLPVSTLINEIGSRFPSINNVFSILEEGHLKKPVGLGIDTRKHNIVATFENLITNTSYIRQIHSVLQVLKEKLGYPVDIEFACDGEHLYLLQCRPQSYSSESAAAIIPKDISRDKIVFTANKYVSNGKIADIHFIVYIDPKNYSRQENLDDLKSIGFAVGKLNKLLPKKSFILMGPGRWGSRDDIRLGVNVTYSDINNTSLLIEIARRKGNHVPDLSFGTHFFQDLVEAGIRYLPLYPDDEGVIFNDSFLLNSENILSRFLPELDNLSETIRVINVPEAANGAILRVLMNADDDEAIAILTSPMKKSPYRSSFSSQFSGNEFSEAVRWRLNMADNIASQLHFAEFGVKALYLFGTVYHESASPNSDIDLIIHYSGTEEHKCKLESWLRGWNDCLSIINYNKTGFKVEKMVDAYFIHDSEFADKKYLVDLMDPKNKSSKLLKKESL